MVKKLCNDNNNIDSTLSTLLYRQYRELQWTLPRFIWRTYSHRRYSIAGWYLYSSFFSS